MGAPDQLAKRVFAEEIPSLFGGRVIFHPGLDLGFAELRLDGILTLDRSVDASHLPAPWCRARPGHISVEVKMPGDHTDLPALERALLRCQALRVVLLEREPPVHDPVALWMVAPHLPAWLPQLHRLESVGQGCYRLETGRAEAVWIATNELPLQLSLLPFLVTRSGKKLAELVRWLVGKRPAGFVTRVLEWSSMSPELAREIQAEIERYGLKAETPEEKEAAKRAARIALAMAPDFRDELVAEALQEQALREQALREQVLREQALREQALREQALREQALRAENEGAQRRSCEQAVLDLCEVFAIDVDPPRLAHIASLDLAGLDALRVHLKAQRSWPA